MRERSHKNSSFQEKIPVTSVKFSHPTILKKFTGEIPPRWGQDLLAMLPNGKGEYCLDFGCGDGNAAHLIESFGYRFIGIDICGKGVSVQCDGHTLPFPDKVFSTAVSIAVFEHLYDPKKAASEIFRVLNNNGTLLGTVAFLEPFHANSYFHMSYLGIYEVLSKAGFKVLRLWPTGHQFEAQVELWMPFRNPKLMKRLRQIARWMANILMGIRSLGLGFYLRNRGLTSDEIIHRKELDHLSWADSIGFLAQKVVVETSEPLSHIT
jgi:SAM-dependent methyltransferase